MPRKSKAVMEESYLESPREIVIEKKEKKEKKKRTINPETMTYLKALAIFKK